MSWSIHSNQRSESTGARVALAPHLQACPEVTTLGIRPCIDDYSEAQKTLLRTATRVFFPTQRYVDIFHALDIPTFPNATTYRYQRSRVLQQLLFEYLDYPHPQTRIYYGKIQKNRIARDFALPVLMMGPHIIPGSSYAVHTLEMLESVAGRHHCIVVQPRVEWIERVRLICVRFECIAAQRQNPGREGGTFDQPIHSGSSLLQEPLTATLSLVRTANLDDIAIDWGYAGGKWLVTGMSRPPVRCIVPGGVVNRHAHICGLIRSGLL